MRQASRAAAAEFFGTAALLLAVVGSGIMAERLSAENAGVALLANALATGFALYVLITIFGPVSRAHFNPVVTFAAAINRELPVPSAISYVVVQCCGAVVGVWLAHSMFELPILQFSGHVRTGIGQWIGEVVATVGLLIAIGGANRYAGGQTAAVVGAYIAGAYWFTASTSFANPAVTLARAMTATFAGIRPADAPAFIGAQFVGMVIGIMAVRLIFGPAPLSPGGQPTQCTHND